jgi:large subunit ribosomal protein L23
MIKDMRGILKTNITTERTALLREQNNEYVFEVDRRATKHQIKQAVEQAFKVKVDGVRTMVAAGKPRRVGRFEGKTSTWKKAFVRLKKNEVITIFEG